MSEVTSETKSSDSTSEDYEVITAPPQASPQLDVMEGSLKDLKDQLRECLENENAAEEDEEEDNEAASIIEDDHAVFHDITYLGSTGIRHPKDEPMIHNYMSDLNSKVDADEVSLAVPKTSEGLVILNYRKKIKKRRRRTFPIHRIIFFARGNGESPESNCFAYTFAKDESLFECHVFRCAVPENVPRIFVSFANAFKKSKYNNAKVPQVNNAYENFKFDLFLEIKEDQELKTNYELVPRYKGYFKLRSNVPKKVVISVQQISKNDGCQLVVERCFGMLVSPGRNVPHADMQLLEKVTMETTNGREVLITGDWDPRDSAFAVLNRESASSDVNPMYMTIAADLVISQIAEPIRFVIETKARIYPQNERYWYYARRILNRQYLVRLKRSSESDESHKNQNSNEDHERKTFDLIGIDISEEMDLKRPSSSSLTLQLASSVAASFAGSIRTAAAASTASYYEPTSPVDEGLEEDTDNDEPLLSGFGEVSKDCSYNELDAWAAVLREWKNDVSSPLPKELPGLVKRGIPEALRGEVWQRLTGASTQQEDIVETYKILITKESPDEKIILRDIHRTFPAHEFFKEAGGVGQESLYRISKAYSVYDSEIGYCQGQSFLIAALLLQMPEEQAFGVLVKIMHDLGLRNIFRENFEQLQLRLYQLDRLIEASMPDLWQHFCTVGLESHMFASQWFLTLFTAKFPLFLVFRVLDVFLLFGFDSIFQVALGIFKVSKKDMLALDFEGLMKYFRVNIPKRYRSEDHARYLLEVAMNIKLKKLKRYEKEWFALKEAERSREDPAVRFERENKKLLSDNLRLDTENDNLARQLVNSKIEMRKEIDALEDEKDYFEKEYEKTAKRLIEAEAEKKRLQTETRSLKELLKREVEKLDSEVAKKDSVIMEYKIITSQLSEKLERSSSQKKKPPMEITEAKGDVSREKSAFDRIRELELELAQTKLALVETECKFQDLNHQFNALQEATPASKHLNNTWLSKTLSSIKETAASAASRGGGPASSASSSSSSSSSSASSTSVIKKSTSVDTLH